MALIGNYSVLNKTPGRWLAGGGAAHATGIGSAQPLMRSNFNALGAMRNVHYPDGETAALKRIGYPVGGYQGVSWMMPYTAGDMASHGEAQGSADGSLSMAQGINIAGLAEGTTPTAEATLQLVVSMLATAAGTSTAAGNVNAALGLAGSAAGTSSESALISALAWAIGQADGSSTATLVRYATGELKGSITPFTDLSPEGLAAAVWNSLVSAYQTDGTMGKALGTASSGGVDMSALAAAILAAAEANPIHANVKEVNSLTVDGTGTESDPWGPV